MEIENDKEYKVDDEVWIVLYPIIIKCKVAKVDDYFRKQSSTAYLFYDVDEPIGHSLPAYDFFDALDDAKEELLAQHDDYCKHRGASNKPDIWDTDAKLGSVTLQSRRERTIKFIKSTWGPGGVNQEEYAKMDAEFHIGIYPNKDRGTAWFNVFDLIGE